MAMALSWLRNGRTQSTNIGKFLIKYESSSFSTKANSEGIEALYKSEPISDTQIKISTLTSKEKYKVEKVSDTKSKFEKVNPKPKHINVISVCTNLGKSFPGEIQKMFNELSKLCREMDMIPTSSLITAEKFNAKIRKRNGSENRINKWSRGRRNDSRSKSTEFCEMNDKVIAGSYFQHPAKHITTWSQKRINPTTKIAMIIYNQIDYIIFDKNKNRPLLNHDPTEEEKHQIICLL